MVIVVGWLVRPTLNVKPWVEQRPVKDIDGDGALRLPTIKVGLGVFLTVATSLFALLISAYHMRMMAVNAVPTGAFIGAGGAVAAAVLLGRSVRAGRSTTVLILAGVAMQWTRSAAQWGQIDNVRLGLIAAGVLTFSFLAGQLWAWQQLNASGYFVRNDPATAFFYLLTALHGLHLLGGMWVWGRTTAKVLRGVEVAKVRLSVELCAVYWHYLLLVWLVLFAVLLHTHT